MTDETRNIRTLIVCFVIAIMALIPLRFIEVGNSMMEQSNQTVLGEQVTVSELPVLESPYDEIEGLR
jgi:hypothetical protein